jgi:hypothetical protein
VLYDPFIDPGRLSCTTLANEGNRHPLASLGSRPPEGHGAGTVSLLITQALESVVPFKWAGCTTAETKKSTSHLCAKAKELLGHNRYALCGIYILYVNKVRKPISTVFPAPLGSPSSFNRIIRRLTTCHRVRYHALAVSSQRALVGPSRPS